MRPWLLTSMVLLSACAPERPIVNCTCAFFWEKAAIEGAFVTTVVDVEVESGSYVPPALPGPRETNVVFEEDVVTIPVADHRLTFGVAAHVEIEPSGERGCCGGGRLIDDGRPWNERNMARIDWSRELGDSFAQIDPTVEAQPTFVYSTSGDSVALPCELDADGLGMTLRTWYFVSASGCTTGECLSRVRVERHFRRL